MIEQAFVSGELAKAVYRNRDGYFVLSLGSSEPETLQWHESSLWLNSGAEFKELTFGNLNVKSIQSALEAETRGHQALFLTLAGLDSALSDDVRRQAIIAAEGLLQDHQTYIFVRNRVLSRPAPENVLKIQPNWNPDVPSLSELYLSAFEAQSAIKEMDKACQRVELQYCDSPEDISRTQQLLMDSGLKTSIVDCMVSNRTEEIPSVVNEYAVNPELRRSIPKIAPLLNALQELILKEHPPSRPAASQAVAERMVARQSQNIFDWIREKRASLIIILLGAGAVVSLAAWRVIKVPSVFPSITTNVSSQRDFHHELLASEFLFRKLVATFLVYFMQFGFIAFESGAVRQRSRRVSAVKNLIVFSVAFLSYICVGWHIQQSWNPDAFSSLLDVAFNAGFASTVALIIANTIAERGTVLVNFLCSIAAAGFAYPLLAGMAFDGGSFAKKTGFVDTAGGLVVHVLGGAMGLSAALLIGPRAKRRAWYRLGKAHVEKENDNTPLIVIGAFFLWFGWLGFNSGMCSDWNTFLIALINTNIGASVGGMTGLFIAVINKQALLFGIDRTRKGVQIEIEIAGLERVVLGMMGGLIAVTANASVVKPWQALTEAALGATVAIVGFAWLVHFKERLDDPLGAIATHGFAGTVGVLCTGLFYDKAHLGVQAIGWAIAVIIGVALAAVPCLLLWVMELLRGGSDSWLYGTLLRQTVHEQKTGKTGTEYSDPTEEIERARAYLRECGGLPKSTLGGDSRWIEAVRVLALAETENPDIQNELYAALDRLLDSRKEGSMEEETAIAAIQARADFRKLPVCVNRALEHRQKAGYSSRAHPWDELNRQYAHTLITTISDLAESFAAEYRALSIEPKVEEERIELEWLIDAFGKGCVLLKQIAEEREPHLNVWRVAWSKFKLLIKLPQYNAIIKRFKSRSASNARHSHLKISGSLSLP